jgi:hypothetical protein
MPIPLAELSTFFDRHYDAVRKDWDRRVDQGAMSEWTRQRAEIRMDEIGMILRVLGEGQAVLTYKPPDQREPAPMIRLWGNDA